MKHVFFTNNLTILGESLVSWPGVCSARKDFKTDPMGERKTRVWVVEMTLVCDKVTVTEDSRIPVQLGLNSDRWRTFPNGCRGRQTAKGPGLMTDGGHSPTGVRQRDSQGAWTRARGDRWGVLRAPPRTKVTLAGNFLPSESSDFHVIKGRQFMGSKCRWKAVK